jgi:hypothetical protein
LKVKAGLRWVSVAGRSEQRLKPLLVSRLADIPLTAVWFFFALPLTYLPGTNLFSGEQDL